MRHRAFSLLLASLLAAPACSGQTAVDSSPALAEVDSIRLVGHVQYLAAPEREGRATGTPGNQAARAYIRTELESAGLQPLNGQWDHPFAAGGAPAVNVAGMVSGSAEPDSFIVVTAHYDHLGRQGSAIFHGADDNASGVGALIELGRYFAAHPPRHSMIFAALDAEEQGLRGARAFVGSPPVPLAAIVLSVNMDMISRNAAGELYAAGTHHYPALTPLVDAVAAEAPVRLLKGHDQPRGAAGDDWTNLSDHGPFHAAGIPFIYFGVEDHPDYHRPTDTFDRIDPGFYVRAVQTVLDFLRRVDS